MFKENFVHKDQQTEHVELTDKTMGEYKMPTLYTVPCVIPREEISRVTKHFCSVHLIYL